MFRQATTPVRAPVPQVFSKGRASSLPGAPVHNPVVVAVFRQGTAPVRAHAAPPFSRGRAYSLPGAPARNPSAGPRAYPLVSPARSRQPLPPRGRVSKSAAVPAAGPAPRVPAPVYPLTQPVRARQPRPAPGRAATMALLPSPVTPGTGPPVYPRTSPARTRILPPQRGRVTATAVTAIPGAAPVARQSSGALQQPAGMRIVLVRTGHAQASLQASSVSNPVTGPQVYPLTQPARARRPLPPRGRTYGNRGAPVHNPSQGPARAYP